MPCHRKYLIVVRNQFSMFRTLFLAFIFLTINKIYAQPGFKKNSYFSFNLIAGYQSFPHPGDLDRQLKANNFTDVSLSHIAYGIEMAIAAKKNIFKYQLKGTNAFTKRNSIPSKLRSTELGLMYGRDILFKSDRSYIYPFIGFELFGYNLLGQSSDGKRLNSHKTSYGVLFGLGLKQFLNDNLEGLLNNIDLNTCLTLPIANAKWQKEGSLYVTETFKAEPTFNVTLSIGKALILRL